MVRIDWASHCGFVQAKTSPCGGGAGTLHSAPDARGSQEEGTIRFKVAIAGAPYLSSSQQLRALGAGILEVFGADPRHAPYIYAKTSGCPADEFTTDVRWWVCDRCEADD